MLLNSRTDWQPTTPLKPDTPSIPNSGMRRLNISTPIPQNAPNTEETEYKALETSPPKNECKSGGNGVEHNDTDCFLSDDYRYITAPDHKQLKKVCESYPEKMYYRIQSRNLQKVDTFLRSKMANFLEKKQRKLSKLHTKSPSNGPDPDTNPTPNPQTATVQTDKVNKVNNDKLEMDHEVNGVHEVNEANHEKEANKGKDGEFSNEQKILILERALAASHQNLMHFNKLLLSPLATTTSMRGQQARLSEERQAQTQRIQEIKKQIEAKRTVIVSQIETLKALRGAMNGMNVEIPLSIRDKMVKNMEYEGGSGGMGGVGVESMAKQERTRQIVEMVNDNKKREMIALKRKREELRENEQRLKEWETQIESEGEKLKEFIDLKQRNRMAMRTDAMEVDPAEEREDGRDDNKQMTRNRAVSMASSIASTIHGSLSPQLKGKFERREENQKWTFSMIRTMHRGDCGLIL